MSVRPLTPHSTRPLARGLLIVLAVLAVAVWPVAAVVQDAKPLFSSDWWTDVGMALGMAGALCLTLQFVIASRLRLLDRLVGLDDLFKAHRVVGITAACLLFCHPFVVFALQKDIGPPVLKQWPLLAGAASLTTLWFAAGVARFRSWLGLSFSRWLPLHRLGVLCLTGLVALHAAFVTDEIEVIAFMPLLGGLFFLAARGFVPGISGRAFGGGGAPLRFRVAGVAQAGREAHEVRLAPVEGRIFDYAPGQFAFVTFLSPALPREEHPWTIASAPEEAELRFTIRCSGDFTAMIGRLSPGDEALVRGPYGRFSLLTEAADPDEDLLFLAAGVGITPMLSMLRHLSRAAAPAPQGAEEAEAVANSNGRRRVRLIWSNREQADVAHAAELESLAESLPGLSVRHVLTRGPDGERLDAEGLAGMIAAVPPSARVFLCGPPGFMRMARAALDKRGFAHERVHWEEFSL
ncbi:oxidoreductase FAD/NAD(P)-binding domain protein [Desulfovibrio sp. X2]|uniref:ferredoxin reductase family protein n=1 Tax=Desulfovibrio sp. X2 TaxID=941449 RepID=UPI0003588783|nr:ferredoxin reductase family protein [Desulfovibrio sp. X2]EPR43110.1 oxidoreductase FAD/NAD(P)-binding domain protein [Desulfovibrio sp. X2]